MLKESYDKLKTDIEFYQEKAEQASQSYDGAQERIQELEARLEEQTKLETQLADSQVRSIILFHYSDIYILLCVGDV